MATLAVIAVRAAAQLYKGAQIKKLKDSEAEAYRAAGKRRMAAATHEAADEDRKKEFIYSRALALAAAQTGDTSDVGLVTLFGDLNAEGEYRILSRLWSGQNDAEGMRFRAEAAEREGKAAVTASYVNAVTSVVSDYHGVGGNISKFTQSGQMAAARATTLPSTT